MTHFQNKLYEIIFEAETSAGKAFDIALFWAIIISVIAVLLDSVASIRIHHSNLLYKIEWFFTILFTAEYIARLSCVRKPLSYAYSFYGIVDLLAILPTYISLFLMGAQSLLVIRALRLFRVFRVLKLGHYVAEANVLGAALKASRQKISVFLVGVLTIILVAATLMYLIEGEANQFTSIPASVYWAIVTMTTVGYGDLTPKTVIGQCLSSVLMIIGYAIIAIPTGIVTAELTQAKHTRVTTKTCQNCSASKHEVDAKFCRNCGHTI